MNDYASRFKSKIVVLEARDQQSLRGVANAENLRYKLGLNTTYVEVSRTRIEFYWGDTADHVTIENTLLSFMKDKGGWVNIFAKETAAATAA